MPLLKTLAILCLLFIYSNSFAQKKYDSPGAGNPILPGYFADPTVKKFGDTFYIYATTDGNGGGFGPSQVWTSKDFVNWSLQDMNWPTTHHYWAPDVTQAKDGKYYMYYCQPVEIFGASSASPIGPWTPLLPGRQPIVKNFLVPNVITLDGQTFKDDDGKMYMFWGTWGIYPNHGCGVGLLNPDMKTFDKLQQIPNTTLKDFFEAPFMFKRNGLYYLTYSSGRCEDDTYRVQYAISKTGPMGPFVYGKNNPILTTSADGTVHGPGHQSVLQDGNKFYIIYHRHNNPHSGGGYHRQVAADQLLFDSEGNIQKVVPSHNGIGYLAKNANSSRDLALNAKVTASSAYNTDFKPEFAVDNNNGTLWKPSNNTTESWLKIDLGVLKTVRNIQTQFEYATWYYQYLIEYSVNGDVWKVYADKSKNTIHGSPMIDIGEVQARYVKVTVLNTEYPGLNKAIWNIRVFADNKYHPTGNVIAKAASQLSKLKPTGLLVDLTTEAMKIGAEVRKWENLGKLGGQFIADSNALPVLEMIDGRKAVVFSSATSMTASFKVPESMLGNSSFSVSTWVYNPSIEDEEPIVSWTDRGGVDLTNASIGYGANKKFGAAAHWGWPDMAYQTLPTSGKWHHITIVFDGTYEKIYVDGKLDKQELKMLYIANLRNFILGTNADQSAFFSGAMAGLKVYDTPLPEAEVIKMALYKGKTELAVYFDAGKLNYGSLPLWKNEGYLHGGLALGNDLIKVADHKGKIAVLFQGDGQQLFASQLNRLIKPLIQSQTPFSIVMSIAGELFKDSQWHQVVTVSSGAELKVFVDGVEDRSKRFGQLFNNGNRLKIDALNSLSIYNKLLNSGDVNSLFSRWRERLPMMLEAADFETQPTALSPGMIRMSAGKSRLPGSICQYAYERIDDEGIKTSSGWINSDVYNDFGTSIDKIYSYSLKVKDNYGNVSEPSKPLKVSTKSGLFNFFQDKFLVVRDYRKDSQGTIWDGLEGEADSVKSEGGRLTLASTDTKWDGVAQRGPFLYKKIVGDFVAEVLVSDVSGLSEKKANRANDVGLMVLAGNDSSNLIQNSIFPGWGVGNMVTNLNSSGRFQFNNASAWKFYPYLQIQRQGYQFYLRASADGKIWQELPGSPLLRKDIGASVKVGLFQCTYGVNSGYGKFKDFRIITKVE